MGTPTGTKGAIYPFSTNFRRVQKADIVLRMRTLVAQGTYPRPRWLQWTERAPPLELQNLKLMDTKVSNPYPQRIQFLLSRFPDLRFQDCFVDGNDWSPGNDRYRDDHPVMQFVAHQLRLEQSKGLSRTQAFNQTVKAFRQRRREQEKRQKMLMASTAGARVAPLHTPPNAKKRVGPLFTTGSAYLQYQMAERELKRLREERELIAKLRRAREGKEEPGRVSPRVSVLASHFEERLPVFEGEDVEAVEARTTKPKEKFAAGLMDQEMESDQEEDFAFEFAIPSEGGLRVPKDEDREREEKDEAETWGVFSSSSSASHRRDEDLEAQRDRELDGVSEGERGQEKRVERIAMQRRRRLGGDKEDLGAFIDLDSDFLSELFKDSADSGADEDLEVHIARKRGELPSLEKEEENEGKPKKP